MIFRHKTDKTIKTDSCGNKQRHPTGMPLPLPTKVGH